MHASGRQPAGFYRHQPDLDRLLLRYDRSRNRSDSGRRARRGQKFASVYFSCPDVLWHGPSSPYRSSLTVSSVRLIFLYLTVP
jgi:hypothetical protein